jgi:hypothetical protein
MPVLPAVQTLAALRHPERQVPADVWVERGIACVALKWKSEIRLEIERGEGLAAIDCGLRPLDHAET